MKKIAVAGLLMLCALVLVGCGSTALESNDPGTWPSPTPSVRVASAAIAMPEEALPPTIPAMRVAPQDVHPMASVVAAQGVTQINVDTTISLYNYHPRLGGRESQFIAAGYYPPPRIMRYLRPGVYADWALDVEEEGYYELRFRHVAGYVTFPTITINDEAHYAKRLAPPSGWFSWGNDNRPWYGWRYSEPITVWLPQGGATLRFTAGFRDGRQYYINGHAAYLWYFTLTRIN